MNTTTASARLTATVASALIAAGILAGASAVSQVHTHNLADYGAAITADDSTDKARSEGVPHMSTGRGIGGSGSYFERMNGAHSE